MFEYRDGLDQPFRRLWANGAISRLDILTMQYPYIISQLFCKNHSADKCPQKMLRAADVM